MAVGVIRCVLVFLILRVDLLGGNFEGLFVCGYDPLVGWVVVEVPNAFRTCHDVEIVGFISVRDNHGMVTPRHEDDIAVLDGHGLVKVTRVAVDAVEDKALRRIDAMIVGFLEQACLWGG